VANFDHWMKFNIGDYLADTMHLSCMQHGIYLLLIMAYFKQGSLPDEERVLARICTLSPALWRRHSPAVMAMFYRDKVGKWRHKRIDAELIEIRRLTTLRAKSARGASKKRWDYQEYLQSAWWLTRRQRSLELADYTCQKCGASNTELHVHHLTYLTIGHEEDADLQVLCAQCHHLEHA
jgi:uncharacterized protein YdaU (DUF1376 family)